MYTSIWVANPFASLLRAVSSCVLLRTQVDQYKDKRARATEIGRNQSYSGYLGMVGMYGIHFIFYDLDFESHTRFLQSLPNVNKTYRRSQRWMYESGTRAHVHFHIPEPCNPQNSICLDQRRSLQWHPFPTCLAQNQRRFSDARAMRKPGGWRVRFAFARWSARPRPGQSTADDDLVRMWMV